MIKVVSFDIGGTLLSGDATFTNGLAQIIEKDKGIIGDFVKRTFMTQKISIEDATTVICNEFQVWDSRRERISSYMSNYRSSMSLYEDVDKVLKQLADCGYQLITLSNHYCIGEPRISELPNYFSKHFYSFDIGYTKPDCRIFHFVESSMKMKSDCFIHVGDSIYSDILGAYRAGWRTILIRRNSNNPKLLEPFIGMIDYMIYELNELIDILCG